ncbi:hypothetical protein BKI52_08155 [marine bacterium AO1-C]|nr:hypothetical protein BKI52_08155 [marine bacterium AO1-C]
MTSGKISQTKNYNNSATTIAEFYDELLKTMKYLPLFLAFVFATSLSFAQRKPNDQYVPVKFKEIQYPLNPLSDEIKTYTAVLEGRMSYDEAKLSNLIIIKSLKRDNENPDLTIRVKVPDEGFKPKVEVKKREETKKGKVVRTYYYVHVSEVYNARYTFYNTKTDKVIAEGNIFASVQKDFKETRTKRAAMQDYKNAVEKNNFLMNFEKKMLFKVLKKNYNQLRSHFEKMSVERDLGVGKVKGKGDRLPDVQKAYKLANEAIEAFKMKGKEAFTKKLNESIDIWKKALTESDLKKRKSRVNDRITRMLNYNLSLAYYLLNDLTNSRKFAQECKKIKGVRYRANEIIKLCKDKEKRYKANNIQFN